MSKRIPSGKEHQDHPARKSGSQDKRHSRRTPVKRPLKPRSDDSYDDDGGRLNIPVEHAEKPIVCPANASEAERKLFHEYHAKHLGAMRHAKAMFKYAQAAGVILIRARKRIDDDKAFAKLLSVLGVSGDEACGFMAFVKELDAWEVDLSYSEQLGSHMVLHLIKELSYCIEGKNTFAVRRP